MPVFTQDYKNNLDFEYGDFHPFYEELKKDKDKDKDKDAQRINLAILKAPDLFNKFPQEKMALKQHGVVIEKVLDQCKKLIEEIAVPDESKLKDIIKQNESARWMVLFGERLGGYCAMSKLSSSQIRNAYSEVKKLELIL